MLNLAVPSLHPEVYGDGHAARVIVRVLEESFSAMRKTT
jgi:hypothetical protein